jgi:hypothetical protein
MRKTRRLSPPALPQIDLLALASGSALLFEAKQDLHSKRKVTVVLVLIARGASQQVRMTILDDSTGAVSSIPPSITL